MRVIVVGAGLAGLVAARHLEAAGADVTILEAQERAGGRVWTARAGFAHGQYADIGAEIVYPTSTVQHALCAELGVALSAMREPKGTAQPAFFDGQLLSDAEIGELYRVLDEALEACPPPAQESVAAWAERQRFSSRMMSLIHAINQYGPCLPLGELAAVDLARDLSATTGFQQIVGGTDTLVQALLGGRDVRYGHVVRLVDHTQPSAVTVHTSGGQFEADRVVVTVPGPVTSELGFDPPLTEERVRALGNLPFQKGVRIVAQYGGLRELQDTLSGFCFTDLSPRWLFSPTLDQKGDAIIASGVLGAELETSTIGPNGMLDLMDRTISTMAGRPVTRLHGVIHSWTHDPFARVVVRVPNEEQRTALIPVIAAPCGSRVFFAGEHTDMRKVSGGMEGAIRSGLRVSAEVLDHL